MNIFQIINTKKKYRKDIDGLRAISVIAVILFHFGLLERGYLGVDVFFVISGYLITGIIYSKSLVGKFSIKDFYIRRVRRILPLVLLITVVALIVGVFKMLPDDLENLAQSIIATNFFGNNILAVLTTKNYWDVVNEFKPLMHTWSLGVEEQFYMVYPFLFMVLIKFGKKPILFFLFSLTVSSMIIFFIEPKEYLKFYLIPYRFFELSIGGIVAIVLHNKLIKHNFSVVLILLLLVLLGVSKLNISDSVALIGTVIVTVLFLISDNSTTRIASLLLENRLVVFIGLLSYSLYMWHQVILSYARYFVFERIGGEELCYISALILVTSMLSYYLVERPMRYKLSFKASLGILLVGFFLTTSASSIIYLRAGVIKDVPELSIDKNNYTKNMHSAYNHRIYEFNSDFGDNEKLKILVIGNSFARDWCNVLLESRYKDKIEVRYQFDLSNKELIKKLKLSSQLVFLS